MVAVMAHKLGESDYATEQGLRGPLRPLEYFRGRRCDKRRCRAYARYVIAHQCPVCKIKDHAGLCWVHTLQVIRIRLSHRCPVLVERDEANSKVWLAKSEPVEIT